MMSFFSKIARQQWVASGFALLGFIACIIPWAGLPIGLHSISSCSGLHFFVGWMAFLCYIAIIVFSIFRDIAGIQTGTAIILSKVCALGTGFFTLLFIATHIGDSLMAGSFVSLAASAGTIVFTLEFVKLK